MNGTYQLASKAQAKNFVLNSDPVGYLGRWEAPATGVTQAGSTWQIKLPCGTSSTYNRKLNLKLLTQAVYYTGGTALATTIYSGTAGTGLTLTPTIVNGVPTSAAVVAGGTGYGSNSVVQWTDATGAGAQFTVTQSSGVVTAVAYVAGSATATPCPPDFLLSSAPLVSPGVAGNPTLENVDPIFYAMRRTATGVQAPLGELNFDWSPPDRNFLRANENQAIDTVGMSQFIISGNINPNATLPSIAAVEEYDTQRNAYIDKSSGALMGFNKPWKRQQQTATLIVGQQIITTLAPKGRLARIWIRCQTTPGTITAVEFWSDGQCRIKDTWASLANTYRKLGYHFSPDPNYQAQSISGSNVLKAALNPINFFDAAILFDLDGREGQALPINDVNSIQLKLTSTAAQNITVYMETLPGQIA